MRIAGITIPDNKQVRYGLTAVYGVGMTRAAQVIEQVKVDPMTKVKDLTPEQESGLRVLIEAFLIEGELRREKSQNIKRLKDIQSYRGMRHSRGLTLRGQRTKTNSRTVRGNKRNTMASGRTKVSKT